MFHALMGRFQLELFIFIAYFSNVVTLTSCVFFSGKKTACERDDSGKLGNKNK
jgi:hypothetical protein